jgi:hypothetical protein
MTKWRARWHYFVVDGTPWLVFALLVYLASWCSR